MDVAEHGIGDRDMLEDRLEVIYLRVAIIVLEVASDALVTNWGEGEPRREGVDRREGGVVVGRFSPKVFKAATIAAGVSVLSRDEWVGVISKNLIASGGQGNDLRKGWLLSFLKRTQENRHACSTCPPTHRIHSPAACAVRVGRVLRDVHDAHDRAVKGRAAAPRGMVAAV